VYALTAASAPPQPLPRCCCWELLLLLLLATLRGPPLPLLVAPCSVLLRTSALKPLLLGRLCCLLVGLSRLMHRLLLLLLLLCCLLGLPVSLPGAWPQTSQPAPGTHQG
jgi:hypothetical protein